MLYVVEMCIFRLVPVAIIAVINAFIIRRVTSLARTKRQWMTHRRNANNARFRGGKIIGYLRRQRTVSRICKQTSAVTVDDRRRQYTGDDEVLDEGNKQ